jgi:hypothetical protein
VLGGACWSFLGLGWPAAVVGAANGLISGARGTYRWTTPTGVLAFVLDSTWAAPMTAGALVAHVVAWLRPGRGGYVARLSGRANRHVYTGGFRVRPGFVITVGNTINNAGATVRVSPRRQRLITIHEDVHVWQGRWFGPLYPILYLSWTLVGGLAGALIWVLNRHRGASLFRVAETCGYYLNPFEWWAYGRDGGWPPPAKVEWIGGSLPVVPPLNGRR